MAILFRITLIVAILQPLVGATGFKVVCFFDSFNPSNIIVDDLENALDDCTHFIYGYATLIPRFHTLSFDGSVARAVQPTDVALLKKKYPKIKFLLSLGGDRDSRDSPQKYMQLLEATAEKQQGFVLSAIRLLRLYEFDGLDLAYHFPRHEAPRVHSNAVQFWRSLRNLFKRNASNPPKVNEHKKLFTNFVLNIRSAFKSENLMLTLSVLPNVNASWYFDIPSLSEHLDFVNLWSFDFHTPALSPREADFPAPLMSPPSRSNRLTSSNVNSQVHYWLSQNMEGKKLILAIPSYGRTWKMTMQSHRHDAPPTVQQTHGPSGTGEESLTPGLLNWLEICDLLRNRTLIVHGSYDYGQYFVYPGNENFTYDTWIGYDGPNIAQYKSMYAREEKLGGVALVDLSSDDYRGICTGLQFPILKYMNDIFT